MVINVNQTFLDILNRQLLKEEEILWSGKSNEKMLFPIDDIPIFYDIDDSQKIYKLVNDLRNDIDNC